MVSHQKDRNKRGWILYELAVSIALLSFMTMSIISVMGIIDTIFCKQNAIIQETERVNAIQEAGRGECY